MAKEPQFRNRIIEYGVKPADQFLAHPKNARIHPQFQREAMKAALDTVGFVAPVLEAKSGYLVDGHERIWAAMQNGNADVPYVRLDIDEDEEAYVLATFDPLTGLASYDSQLLDDLLKEIDTDNEAINAMLANLSGGFTAASGDDWASALGGLADGDRAPFQQMTFTLHDDQAELVKRALDAAKDMGAFVDTGNENSNGNALARVCELFLGQHG